MRAQTIKKGFCLLIVDIVIIIGIFALQFRTDSTFTLKLGQLQVTLENTEDNNSKTLKNKMSVSYNGLLISFDEQNPAKLITANKNSKDLQLVSYNKKDDFTYEFNFTEKVNLYLSLSSLDSDATLLIRTDLPNNTTFYLPYGYSYNAKIKKDDGNRVVLGGKKSSWEFQAHDLENNRIVFTSASGMAVFNAFDDTQKFTFDSITDLAIADSGTYQANVAAFKAALISSFKTLTVDANSNEQTIVSYIAAMAEKGEYVRAIDDLPQTYKKSPQRTYLSAPYLNNLEEMNQKLETAIADNTILINRAASSLNLDIFTVRNIAAFMCIHPNKANVIQVLNNAAGFDFATGSLSQAVGVLQVYVDLLKYNPDYAAVLQPALDSCEEKIATSCALNGSVLTVSENDTFLSVVQAVETGVAVLRYGLACNSQTLQKAGYALVNSYLAEVSSFDLRTLSNLYPILAFDNWYYPHFAPITVESGDMQWAWTCARSITAAKTGSEEITYTIDFPETYIQYVILKGVPRFHTIYIYDMAFRTDPRFETYNSSGYVYHKDTKTLLLKSRHREQKEIIRIETGEPPVPVAKPAAVVESEPAAEEEETTSEENTEE